MLGRIVKPADFQRVLAVVPRSRSAHFTAHHLAAEPARVRAGVALGHTGANAAAGPELSTGDAPSCPPLVDDRPAAAPAGHWLGLVVPKRHARRAVTRTLLKRQMRQAMADSLAWSCAGGAAGAQTAGGLPPGLWVLRLKAGFDRKLFPSAASQALRAAVRDELQHLLARAAGRPARHAGAAAAVADPGASSVPAGPSGPAVCARCDGSVTRPA